MDQKNQRIRNARCLRFRLALLVLAGFLSLPALHAQQVGVKTNALYWATTTPNVGLEVALGKKHSVQAFYGLNLWKQSGGDESSLRHWSVMPEYRYWFCQAFNGWFVGAHLMGGEFDAGAVGLPFGLFSSFKENRYEGWYVGGGFTAGYQWALSRHWAVEAALGVGYDYVKYDKATCGYCSEIVKSAHTNYFGITKAALSVIYVF